MAKGIKGPKIAFFIILLSFGIILPCSPLLAGKPQLKIAMLLWLGETEAETGFREGMQELGYTVEYTDFDLGQDLKELGVVLNRISSDIEQFDYVYTFGTTVSRRAKLVIQQRVPQVFNAVTDPVGAGIVDSLTAPGRFISGATDKVPLPMQVQGMLTAAEIEKLGFFFNPREKNSMLIRDELYRLARQHNFVIMDFRCPPQGNFLEENLERLVETPGLVDAVFMPSDSYLSSRSEFIAEKLLESRVVSFGSLRQYIEDGMLMGVVIDYYRLGKALARILDHHQQRGSFHDIPVVQPDEYEWLVNPETQKLLGVSLPEKVLAKSKFLQ